MPKIIHEPLLSVRNAKLFWCLSSLALQTRSLFVLLSAKLKDLPKTTSR